jgi:hypothetical protein
MKKIFIVLGVLVVLAGMGVAWWKYEFPSGSWRYKITVTVETPEGIKTGSAVREVHVRTEPQIFPEQSPIHHSVKGEAVVVDLGGGEYVFAIMDVDGSYRIVQTAFPYPIENHRKYIRHYESLIGQKKILDRKDYPTFVTFKDTNDPKSVELVYGGKFDKATQKFIPVDDFDKIYGRGVRIKEVTIEMTDEPVMWKIEKVLGWLERAKGGYLDGQFSGGGPDLSNILHGGHFSRGDLK